MSDGGPAFPIVIERFEMSETYLGMSLRDYFAALAMQGLLTSSIRNTEWAHVERTAKDAYKMADAMLAERDRA